MKKIKRKNMNEESISRDGNLNNGDAGFKEFYLSNKFYATGEYDKAEEILKKGLKRSIKNKDNVFIEFYYNILGSLFIMKNEFNKALKYYKKAEKINHSIHCKISIATTLYHYLKDIKGSLSILNRVTKYCLAHNKYQHAIYEAYLLKAEIYYDNNKIKNCIFYLEKALRIRIECKWKDLEIQLLRLNWIENIIDRNTSLENCKEYLQHILSLIDLIEEKTIKKELLKTVNKLLKKIEKVKIA